MEYEALPFSSAFALRNWVLISASLAIAAVVFSLLASFMKWGPRGGAAFRRGLTSYLGDIFSMSPTRVLAVARLTLKEAIRRKALIVFVFFAVVLMFAGWFMSSGDSRSNIAQDVQIWFLLTAISWLVLPAVMFLSCWSIPEEIRIRSLHTVVTKPTRRIEIVLGRIVGFGGIVAAVVLLMGSVGLIWIHRQVGDGVPKSSDDASVEVSHKTPELACRVPAYGTLYFRDRSGVLAEEGVNTGDVWAYRSYIEGNTRARAVWQFRNVSEEMLIDADPDDSGEMQKYLRLESRFEAFRTVKGSESSMDAGLEAQYTLLNDLRDRTFSLFAMSPAFRTFGEELVRGEFRNASQSLQEITDGIDAENALLDLSDFNVFRAAANSASMNLDLLEDDFTDLAKAMADAGVAARSVRTATETAALKEFSNACQDLIRLLDERSEELLEAMPRIEVPLKSFHVTEYHEGEDAQYVPRSLRYAADQESLARYLTTMVSDWNEDGTLISDGQFKTDLAAQLAESTDISGLNAELLTEVLQEEVDAGALTIVDGQLVTADGQSLLPYFFTLVRGERLTSQDPEGWVLSADLIEDLLYRDLLTIEVSCLNSAQFIGMAQPDLFIRMKDAPFWQGYFKALLTTILSLTLVVVIGVTASCIVKGPVALFLTFGMFLVGQVFHQFMIDILVGRVEGGGMLTSTFLIIQQRNPEVGVNVSKGAGSMIEAVDRLGYQMLYGAAQIIPDFGLFSRSAAYIESGFDVPWQTLLLPAIMTFIGFLIPCVLLASALLKFRELEAK